MHKVLCLAAENPEYARLLGEHGIDISYLSSTDEDEIAAAARGCQGILFTSTRFTDSLFSKLPDLKIISRSGIGLDTVDMEAATAHGVIVCNSASYGTYDVAQHTVALLLSLVHSVPRYDAAVRDRNDWSAAGIPMASRLSARTLGIVGFGRISRWIAKMMSGFGMKVLVYDPFCDAAVARELGVTPVLLDELCREADIISLNAPLTDSTYHTVNEERIAMMKDGVLIVNTSRGPLIDEAALVRGLVSGKIGGAALDVFETEPFAADHPFRTLPNVILTPHVAWRSTEALYDLVREVTGNLIDYFEGKPLPNAQNARALGLI